MAAPTPDIRSPHDLERWLDDKPPDWARTIAARAALRIFPLVFTVLDVPDEAITQPAKQDLILQTFRAAFVTWTSQRYPAFDMTRAAANAAAAATTGVTRPTTATATAAANAVAIAAYAAFDTANLAAIEAVGAADEAVARAEDDRAFSRATPQTVQPPSSATFWHSITEDCRWLEANDGALIGQPLWLNPVAEDPNLPNMPDWAREPLDEFDSSKLGRDIRSA